MIQISSCVQTSLIFPFIFLQCYLHIFRKMCIYFAGWLPSYRLYFCAKRGRMGGWVFACLLFHANLFLLLLVLNGGKVLIVYILEHNLTSAAIAANPLPCSNPQGLKCQYPQKKTLVAPVVIFPRYKAPSGLYGILWKISITYANHWRLCAAHKGSGSCSFVQKAMRCPLLLGGSIKPFNKSLRRKEIPNRLRTCLGNWGSLDLQGPKPRYWMLLSWYGQV